MEVRNVRNFYQGLRLKRKYFRSSGTIINCDLLEWDIHDCLSCVRHYKLFTTKTHQFQGRYSATGFSRKEDANNSELPSLTSVTFNHALLLLSLISIRGFNSPQTVLMWFPFSSLLEAFSWDLQAPVSTDRKCMEKISKPTLMSTIDKHCTKNGTLRPIMSSVAYRCGNL